MYSFQNFLLRRLQVDVYNHLFSYKCSGARLLVFCKKGYHLHLLLFKKRFKTFLLKLLKRLYIYHVKILLRSDALRLYFSCLIQMQKAVLRDGLLFLWPVQNNVPPLLWQKLYQVSNIHQGRAPGAVIDSVGIPGKQTARLYNNFKVKYSVVWRAMREDKNPTNSFICCI